MFDMADMSTPVDALPERYMAAAGYIGEPSKAGAPDTPHIWTPQEWARFAHLKKLPIFTRSNPEQASPADDAFNALMSARNLGIPKGSPIAWDMETAADPVYLLAAHEIIAWGGYRMWVYGSASTVFSNPSCDGYWVADWTGRPHMHDHPETRATQWRQATADEPWDASVIKWWQFEHVLRRGWHRE